MAFPRRSAKGLTNNSPTSSRLDEATTYPTTYPTWQRRTGRNRSSTPKPANSSFGHVHSSFPESVTNLLSSSRLSSCALRTFIRRRCACLSFSCSAAARTRRTASSTLRAQSRCQRPSGDKKEYKQETKVKATQPRRGLTQEQRLRLNHLSLAVLLRKDRREGSLVQQLHSMKQQD